MSSRNRLFDMLICQLKKQDLYGTVLAMLACVSPYEVLLCGGSWQEQKRKKETKCTQVTRHLCLISYNCRAISWMNGLTQPDKCSPRQAAHRAHQTRSSKLPSKPKTPVAGQPNWILNQSFVKENVAVWDKYFCVDSHTAKNEQFFFCQLKKYCHIQTAVGYNREIPRLSKQPISVFTSQ